MQPTNATTRTNRGIHVRDVHKTYVMGPRRVHALRGVNLEITEPGFYGIMGPSGSGKSTLLHLLSALDRPDSGQLTVSGERLDTMSERELTMFRRHRIGIVFQRFNLISTLSAIDNVTLPAMLDGMGRKQREQRGRQLLDALGMSERASHRPDALSGGEQQRIAIARALMFEPAVLFADEPTGNLDSNTSEQVWKLLGDLAVQHEMTVLMVTHEPSAAEHCGHIYMMRDGVLDNSFNMDDDRAGKLATGAEFPVR